MIELTVCFLFAQEWVDKFSHDVNHRSLFSSSIKVGNRSAHDEGNIHVPSSDGNNHVDGWVSVPSERSARGALLVTTTVAYWTTIIVGV